ncbi:hypothetical protein D1007_03504 [Hordeum vulgare]|nr:hypothetical protein D1007_03504 [Hordeum vulgare]
MAAVSAKLSVAFLAAVVLVALVASAAGRIVDREDEFFLGSLAPSLAPAPAPAAVHGAAGAVAPGAWAVAAVVSLLAFLAH